MLLFSSSMAFAEIKFELADKCLSNVERALDDTNADDSGCTGGAFVGNVDAVNGDVYSISYGRSVCEGAISGTAHVTLNVTKVSATKSLAKITACTVEILKVTDESADSGRVHRFKKIESIDPLHLPFGRS